VQRIVFLNRYWAAGAGVSGQDKGKSCFVLFCFSGSQDILRNQKLYYLLQDADLVKCVIVSSLPCSHRCPVTRHFRLPQPSVHHYQIFASRRPEATSTLHTPSAAQYKFVGPIHLTNFPVAAISVMQSSRRRHKRSNSRRGRNVLIRGTLG
jgi:hypothetical protein